MTPTAAIYGNSQAGGTGAEIMSFIASLPTQQIAQAVKESASGAGDDIGNKVVLGFGLLAAVLWFTRK